MLIIKGLLIWEVIATLLLPHIPILKMLQMFNIVQSLLPQIIKLVRGKNTLISKFNCSTTVYLD